MPSLSRTATSASSGSAVNPAGAEGCLPARREERRGAIARSAAADFQMSSLKRVITCAQRYVRAAARSQPPKALGPSCWAARCAGQGCQAWEALCCPRHGGGHPYTPPTAPCLHVCLISIEWYQAGIACESLAICYPWPVKGLRGHYVVVPFMCVPP